MADDPWAAYRVAAPTADSSSLGGDPWANYRVPTTPEPAKPSTAADVARAVPVGLAKGTIGLVGTPGDVQNMGNTLSDRLMLGVGHKVMDWTGWGPQAGTPEREDFDRLYTGIGSGSSLPGAHDIEGVVTKAVPLPDAETPLGRFVQRGAEFVPGAAALGGGPGVGTAGRVVGDWLVPFITSEAAGKMTEGTKAEPYARALGGLAGGLGTGAYRAWTSAPERIVQASTSSVTPAQWDEAARISGLGQGTGVQLSGPESVAQAANGSKLTDVLRAVEGSTHGGDITQAFFGQRPQQVNTAVNRALDTVGPQDPRPSTLGPRAAESAQNVLDAEQRNVNAITRPSYQAAENHVLDPADFDPIARDPAFQASLRRLRNDEVLGPTYANSPDNSVRVIDAVTKDMRDRGVALGNSANPGFSAQTAGMYGSGAAEARAIARDPARGGVQAYDDALTVQEAARRQHLDPLQQGPVGAVAQVGGGGAGTLGGTEAAANVILRPAGTNVGGQHEVGDAVARMVAESAARDPTAVPSLVRQGLANAFDQASAGPMTGQQEYAGAKFRNAIAGSPQQRANMDAAVGALPNGQAANRTLGELLPVLQATGQRKQPGSPTAFNTELGQEMGEMPKLLEVLSHPWTAPKDMLQRLYLGRNQGRLADMFVAPDSVEQLREIAGRARSTPLADALVRGVAQSPIGARP